MALYSGITKQRTHVRQQGWRFWAGMSVALAVASGAFVVGDDALNGVTAAILDASLTDAVVVADPAPTGAGSTLPTPGSDDRDSVAAATMGERSAGKSRESQTNEEQRRLILLQVLLNSAGLRYFGGLSKH
jgi:hypothetical protein